MHKTGVIATLGLLTLAPVAVRAQNPPPPAAGANPQPATVGSPPVTVLKADTVSFTALQMRVLELERQRPDPEVEKSKWAALRLIGIAFAVAWVLVRSTEKQERVDTATREVMKELVKNPAANEKFDARLTALEAKLSNAAGKFAALNTLADTTISKIKVHLSGSATQAPPGN